MLKSRMAGKFTYEELEQRNGMLERKVNNHKQVLETLVKSNHKFKNIYEESPVGIELYDSTGKLIDINNACLEIFGVDTVEELKGFNLLNDPNLTPELKAKLKTGEAIKEKNIFDFEKVKKLNLYKTTKSGIAYHNVSIEALRTNKNDPISGYIVQVQDITDFIEQEQLGNALKHNQITLEQKVKDRTIELENMNATLSVLLKKREDDKKQIEEKIFANYQSVVSPFLQKLKNRLTKKDQHMFMEIIETNLKEVLLPFSQKLSDPVINLAPSEIRRASMIKQGLTNKEIAQILNNSIRTITNHRQHIRIKLNLKNKKINLRSFLSTLK